MNVQVPERANESLLRKREVAAQLDVCGRTVERLVAAGKLRRIKVLGAVRFRMSEVQNLMNGGAV